MADAGKAGAKPATDQDNQPARPEDIAKADSSTDDAVSPDALGRLPDNEQT